MTSEQTRFLLLRAYTYHGHTATITKAGIEEMCELGWTYMVGGAGVKVTTVCELALEGSE